MTSHKIVFLALLLCGLLSAFDVSQYLYAEETNVSVSYTNFTLDGTDYSIVSLNGVETFLLEEDAPLSEQAEIESILHDYYMDTYYPTDDDIKELRGLIKQFNDSRNDGYDFKNKEEYSCRDEVLLSNGKITVSGKPVICKDNESCTKNAMLLFSVYGEGLNLGSATAIIGPLMDFTPSSLLMDELLANYTARLDQMDQENIIPTLEYIKDTSGQLETLSKKIEGTIFRTPRLNDTADRKACQLKCWAICPSFDLDQSAAKGIKSKAEELYNQLDPLSEYSSIAEALYTNTATRMEKVKNENTALYYSDRFRTMNRTGQYVINAAEDALVHVQNRSLSQELDDLKSLHVTIPEDIAAHRFENIETDINQYQMLTASVRNMSDEILVLYNATRDAKNAENSLMLVLQSKDLDAVSMKSLESLQNQTEDLNAQFHDGMTLAQLEALKTNYTELADKARALLKSESDTPASGVLLLFRGFARKVNTGIAMVVEKTDLMPRESVPSSAALSGFSALVFLSFASMALLLFLYIFSTVRFTIPRTNHILGMALAVLLILILIFSVFMYLFLGKTATDASFQEFLNDFSSKKSSSIVVDLRNASFADANAMSSCATSLASILEERNRTWTMYTLTAGSCTMSNMAGDSANNTIDACLAAADADQSDFLLGYSDVNQPPRFSIIYDCKAVIQANTEYYDSCPFVALFS